MSMLVIQLPARSRAGAAAPEAATDYRHVLSTDGLAVSAHGRSVAARLPRADTVVAVLPPAELSWHRLTLPRAPASRLRAALAGVLEEQLLDEDDQVHLALAPEPRPGQPTWVAAAHRPWLAAQIAALEQSGLVVDRVVPAFWPQDGASGHFFAGAPTADTGSDAGTDPAAPWLVLADAQGVQTLRLGGGLARRLHTTLKDRSISWTAEPAVAAAAEQWLGAPVAARGEADALLAAARSPWNLRQFSLVSHHRGLRELRALAKTWLGPEWRPLRWGLAALLLVQLLGLNLWAWHERRTLAQREQALVAVLRSSHPQVQAVLDAPVQMQRETELLRAMAGRAGDADLEPLLALAAQAWPPGQPPVQTLRFEAGKLSLSAAGWPAPMVDQFRARVVAAGGQVESADGRLTVSRAAPARGKGA
jgi:general secretion pathway protein L